MQPETLKKVRALFLGPRPEEPFQLRPRLQREHRAEEISHLPGLPRVSAPLRHCHFMLAR